MMRRSELKKKCDPELGRFTRQHIYGEGVRMYSKILVQSYLERQ